MTSLENNSRFAGSIATILVAVLGTALIGTANGAGPGASTSAIVNLPPFANGLNNPRGLKFGTDGNLYVAEGGVGGTDSTARPPPLCEQAARAGPYTGGRNG